MSFILLDLLHRGLASGGRITSGFADGGPAHPKKRAALSDAPLSHTGLRFCLLGPVRAWRGTTEVDVGSPQQRLVLAVLLLARGRAVSHDQLLDAVWGEDHPRTAISILRTYVSRLRAVLGGDAVVSVGNGYALVAGTTDLADVEELSRQGRYAEALALWQGEPLAGLSGDYAEVQRTHLSERRLTLLERRIGEDIDRGRHAEVVPELTVLCAEHPTREQLAGLLMLALYRSGRRAEAIGVFTDTRKLLDDELGIDPSVELADLHYKILTGDPGLEGKAPESPSVLAPGTRVPRQLPADVTDFTGREPDVEQVTQALREGASSALAIAAVAGAGGMGKTVLAVHVAHRLAPVYPDGQLFVDLQGTAQRPVDPATVLGAFLRALGVDAASIPEGLEERSALYRSVLADRQVLVLLDNAASAVQIRPLLPGAAGCAVLVTSRARLSGLSGARHLDLRAMPPDEALTMLVTIVGKRRVDAEREAARALMWACGYLPLAIRIVASRLAARPSWSLARMRDRMADERRRLDELSVDGLAVEATFALGYDQLDEAHAAAFRLLAMPNMPDMSAGAAAAVLDLPEAEAENLCEALVNLHMMESPAPGRYRHHNLLKIFARSRPEREEVRRAALDRLLGFYLAGMTRIFRVEYPEDPRLAEIRPSHSGPSFAGLDAGLEWGVAEESYMLCCIHQVATTPGTALLDAVTLIDLMSDVLDFESNTTAYEKVAYHLVEAAVARGDLVAEAYARRKRAEILYAGKAAEAAAQEARNVRDLDPHGKVLVNQAHAANILAMLAHDRRAYDEAVATYEEAIGIWRALGNRSYETVVLGNLAVVLSEAGRGAEALEAATEAAALSRELRGGEPSPLIVYQLGVALAASGRHDEALARFRGCCAEFRRLKQHTWVGLTLRRMAQTYLNAGRPEGAVDHAEEALAILADTEPAWIRGKVLTVLGRAFGELGRSSRARACLTEALAILTRQDLPDADDVRAMLAADLAAHTH